MQGVFVLSNNKTPLVPCPPARARALLREAEASVYRQKASLSIEIFLKDDPQKLNKILGETKISLNDTASVNATKYTIGEALKNFKRPVRFWSGGRTKFNRCSQHDLKDHWIDGVCVGESGRSVLIAKNHKLLSIKAECRGSRQKCFFDQYGFPRTSPKGAEAG